MDQIVDELEFALALQTNINLDLLKISKLAVPRLSYRSEKELISHLSKGILVDDGKRWALVNKNKEVLEMISAAQCFHGHRSSCGTHKDSRFSNIFSSFSSSFKVNVKTQFLVPHIKYTMNLVFKHDINKYWIYVPFKYKSEEETRYSNSQIVKVREDGWLMTELYQFTSYQKEHDFKIEFLNFATTTRSRDFEGIEFRPIEHENDENLEDKNKAGMQQIPIFDMDCGQNLSPEYVDIIKLSKDNIEWTTKKELYLLLRKGFLMDKAGEKYWFSICKNMKKRLMIPAYEMLIKKDWIWKSLPESRFEVVAESLNVNNLKLLFRIKSEMFSNGTSYSCSLIYKLPENSSLLEDLITMQNIGSSNFIKSFYLVPLPPTPVIQFMADHNYDNPSHTHKIKGHPKARKDGWMEIQLCEVLTDATNTIRMLFLFQGSDTLNFAGLVIQGIEFREL
ncbi:hypothetical protein L2E82_48181 [Cichorium intybus]|uniref:Uncharacterized protein n=1 Tax=Cichorium intybus TaxID=13427 RepID=A0ACB8Z1Q7_CICIN|nr:hypothetical protein L2E82_48181 [Cichorium intybus]